MIGLPRRAVQGDPIEPEYGRGPGSARGIDFSAFIGRRGHFYEELHVRRTSSHNLVERRQTNLGRLLIRGYRAIT